MTRWQRLRRSIKFFWQRQVRGWDDSEMWDLDVSLAEFIHPRLERFREITNCNPFGVGEEYQNQWYDILDKMILAFRLSRSLRPNTKEEEEKIREGLELFAKYFNCLWD